MMKMETCFLLLLVVALSFTGSYGKDAKACMHEKYTKSIGSEGYTDCWGKSGATDIPKMKQCFQEVMKTRNVVKTASNGQMTVDREQFHQSAKALKNTAVGKAMLACHQQNKEDMYKEAARASQCVFEELKKGC